jgi:magnesium and cobalt transporter
LKRAGFIEKLFGKNEDEEVDRTIGREAQEMIRGIVDLSGTTVKEIMVPRIDVVSLDLNTPIKEMLDTIIDCGHSRFPVYKDTIDNVVGILYVKDLLRHIVKNGEDIKLDEIIRTPYFVPESKKLDSMLREFKIRKVHIAVAVDEYGGTSGIVCMEDVIEEIVGEIQDEFDNETEDILEIGERAYLCDARINIQDLNKQLSLSLPEEDIDTLGGFVFNLFGKIPVKFEKVRYGNLDFIVQEMEGHKILSVKLIINEVKPQENAAQESTG